MPYTLDEFLAVYAAYNQALWPLPLLGTLLGLTVVALYIARPPWGDRAVAGILAAFWLLVGGVYHLAFFTAINPLAYAYAALFIVQGVLLAWDGAWKARWRLGPATGWRGWLAALLVVYALAIQPLVSLLGPRDYPDISLAGVAPCPTTLLTLGVLLLTSGGPPWRLLAIPLAWTGIGGSAAVLLGVPQDYGLIVAGALVLTVALGPSQPRPAPS
ncbi:hypothetical protein AN478_03855 [Thiohalorhabdus denitrificans]|uniref:Uncharacterized protein n=1 Tax=Thiohalorhabdus denitrificans TaxID=381306 RepID=A0A0P9ERF0_9GAMM|nr:DUF6064 family protein [Thiohalorhabdus denitrificans]KPV41068.1 hypothetical protein AN478_03855 [Thiohalorhabdus denitrificans]SCY39853.1 hypothetical protein SAMN05661077_2007 [Thiohalorhabdus denitrificans]